MARKMVGGGALLSLIAAAVSAQNTGAAPGSKVDAIDPYTEFHLPPLKDAPDGALFAEAGTYQAWVRARKLGLSGRAPVEAWSAAEALLRAEPAQPADDLVPVETFEGGTASALNRVLATAGVRRVRVRSAILTLDQPILISRNGVSLELGDTQLISAMSDPYMIRIERVSGSAVRGGRFIKGDSGILISNAIGVLIESAHILGLAGNGIVVTGSGGVRVRDNQIEATGRSPILVHRGTWSSLVHGNRITGALGASNMSAGIVISDREVDVGANPRAIYAPDGHWVVMQPIVARLNPPRDNVIADNHVTRNISSGIYVDGGVRNVIVGNTVEGNAKEGVCLDNGAAANVLSSNIIRRNGKRWGQSDEALVRDFSAAAGRLPDGTAAEKVPGVSIDNAIYNLIFANQVSFNYGGGIKLVRTAFFNLVGLNTVLKNNEGASPAFHFFGIELGAAEADSVDDELDFSPSRGNIIFSNTIRGDHYAGIFFGAGSDQNDVFDNVILDALEWGLESVAPLANWTLNNLTNVPSRNVGSGIDPALLTIGAPQITP